MKVQFVGGSVLGIGSATYKRGDILEIPEKLFIACPDLYVKVEKEAKVTEPAKVTINAPTTEQIEKEEKIIEEIMEADTTTKEGKKKAERASKKATDK